MRGTRMIAAAGAVAGLVGCAPGAANPLADPPPGHVEPNTYNRKVDAAGKILLETAERIRRIDPCGLLPEALPAGYGAVRGHGPRSELDVCTATVVSAAAELEVSLDLSPGTVPAVPSADAGDRPDTGERDGEPDGDGSCTRRFPLGLPVTVSADTAPPVPGAAVTVRSRDGAAAAVSACALATEVVAVASTRTAALPPRPVSGPGRLRLATADPCEMLGMVGADHHVDWRIDGDPYRCAFTVVPPGEAATAWLVEYTLEPAHAAGPEVRFVDVDGYTVAVRSAENRCRMSVPVEAARTGAGTAAAAGEVPSVVVTVASVDPVDPADPPGSGGCDTFVGVVADVADLAVT